MTAWEFGVGLWTGQSPEGGRPAYDSLVPLGRAAEAAGFDSFWVSEHHGMADGYLPSPLVALGALASATTSIRLGTGLALAPLHHPVRLAEDAVVVDNLSNGRLILGLGLGYSAREYSAFDVDPAGRGAHLTDLVGFLRAAFLGKPFSWHGPAAQVDDLLVTPAPVGDLPVWLGGYAEGAVRRAGLLADGHIVGRGQPHILAAASEQLAAVRPPGDRTFTRAVNLACVLTDEDGDSASARAGFTYQQASYEAIQTGRDVYGGLVADPGAAGGLAEGSIDSYVQVAGTAPEVADQLAEILRPLGEWATVHVVLRVLFPGESLATQVERLAAFGDRVLPQLRERL